MFLSFIFIQSLCCTFLLSQIFPTVAFNCEPIVMSMCLTCLSGTRLPGKGPTTGSIIGAIIGVIILLAIIGTAIAMYRKHSDKCEYVPVCVFVLLYLCNDNKVDSSSSVYLFLLFKLSHIYLKVV